VIQPTLLIATNNHHKLHELREILRNVPVSLVSPRDAGIDLEVEESGRTYRTNARLKALAFARAGGTVALADDSGLEVAALNGAPGIYSSRYAGRAPAALTALLSFCTIWMAFPAKDARRDSLPLLPWPAQRARGLLPWVCAGLHHTRAARRRWLGYDPVFYLPTYGCTMADLAEDIKNAISHRARAALRAVPHIVSMCTR